MNWNMVFRLLLVMFVLALSREMMQACSMYKITAAGRTMVGCNEDAWRTTSRIWFENARSAHEKGAAFTGSRQVFDGRTAPQSGMNVAGLTFSRLAAYYPKEGDPFSHRIKIVNEVDYLTDILHQCSTVADVRKYIEQYDHSRFIEDVFIYIDSTGKYLIVEPYQLMEGNDPYYVLSNFCPSITDIGQARTLTRYRNGDDFLKAHEVRTTLAYCTALSDTMHVCRSRNGDGTLLTSIWDTKEGLVNLYFYHDFAATVQFNLAEALSKGDHIIDVPDLFPVNHEFERLRHYKTPFNTPRIRVGLVLLAGILTVFSILLSVFMIRRRKTEFSPYEEMMMFALNLLLIVYLFVLSTNSSIYYFDAPYRHYGSMLISASSYIPFLQVLTIVPIARFILEQVRSVKSGHWVKALLLFNSVIYLMLMGSFGYWGLYSFWK